MLVPRSANPGPRPSVKAFRPTITLTEGAGGFLPGEPLGCLGMWDQGDSQSPGPLRDAYRAKAGAA
jgi:hypothetical protein